MDTEDIKTFSDESENSFLESDSAHTSFYTAKLKNCKGPLCEIIHTNMQNHSDGISLLSVCV